MSDEPQTGEGRSLPTGKNPDDAVDPALDESSPAEPAASRVDLSKDGVDEDADSSSTPDTDTDRPVRESALVGAAAGSARAAARRSGVRAGSTPVKGAATRARDTSTVAKVGIFARLQRFLREVVAELRKVIWPARNQMVTYTIVVIVFVVFMVALTAGLDVLFAKGVLAVFG